VSDFSEQPGRDDDAGDMPVPSAAFARDLGGLFPSDVAADARVDAAVLRMAGRGSLRRRLTRRTFQWGASAAAIAAALLLAVRLVHPPASTPAGVVAFSPAGIDHGGRVTILDAFYVARQLRDGRPPDKSWDVNHDGVVDQKDVDALARQAVRLNGGMQ
jgi:hypothetical protein